MNQNGSSGNDRIQKIRERRKAQETKQQEPIRLQTINTHDQETESYLEQSRRSNRKFNTRWISGILACIFGVLTGCYAYLPMFRFDNISVTGMEKINKDEVIYFTGAKGQPVFTVNPEEVRETLLTLYHDVYDAEVTIGFPAEMKIALTERIPIIEWDFGGSRFWIDKDGLVLNESSSQAEMIHVYADSYPGAPNQEDRNIPAYFSRDVLRSILTMGEIAPKDRPLYFTYKNGFGWDTDEGWRIFFGKTDTDIEEKLRMEKSLTDYFHKNGIEPIFVSLEYKDAPYYRFVEN